MTTSSTSQSKTSPLVIRSAIVASLGGLLFGFDTAVISGAEEKLKELYALSSVGEGMIGAYVDRCASRIASLESSGPRSASVSVAEASGLLATLLERVGVRVSDAGADLSLAVSTDGRTLRASLSDEQVRAALTDALTTSPAVPTGSGLYCVDPAFVLDADALCAGAALAVLVAR